MKKEKQNKQKAKTYRQGLRLKTPRPAVFEDKRFRDRGTAKINFKKNLDY